MGQRQRRPGPSDDGGGNPSERYRSPDGDNLVEQIPHPPFIRQDTWTRSKQAFQPKDGDVWVATFPKCGTTFMEQIILLLWQDGDPSKLDPAKQNNYNPATGVGKVWVEEKVRSKAMIPQEAVSYTHLTLPTTPYV